MADNLDAAATVHFAHLIPPQKVIGKASHPAVQEFRGIPYASVPGRWRHSVLRHRLPTDTFYATKNGPRCPQPPEYSSSERTYQSHLDWPTDVGESEFDCLNLFIVRPSPAARKNAGFDGSRALGLPVLINIHGGGFGWGASTDPAWDPTRLVLRGLALGKPLIVVTINYRLGIFGMGFSSDMLFAQKGDGELRGANFGLGDQRVAMRWVSQNISAFGGDPTKVTIAGQSAGGVSIHAHILEAKFGFQPPLFHRAIQQSGAFKTMYPKPVEEVDQEWPMLYDTLGIREKSQQDRFNSLLKVSSEDLLAAAVKLGWLTFHPVKDDLTICNRPAGRWWVHLGQKETRPANRDWVPNDPLYVLIGDCENECSLVEKATHFKSFADMKAFFRSIVPSVSESAIDEIFTTYGLTPTTPLLELHRNLSKFMSDRQFSYPVEDARQELCSTAADQLRPADGRPALPTEIRPYRFKCGNPFPGPNYEIAHHCLELIYVYDCFYVDLANRDQIEQLSTHDRATNASLVSEVQKWWIDFIAANTVSGTEGVATVFDVDRKPHLRDTSTDSAWTAMKKRFNVIDKYFNDANLMWEAVRKMP